MISIKLPECDAQTNWPDLICIWYCRNECRKERAGVDVPLLTNVLFCYIEYHVLGFVLLWNVFPIGLGTFGCISYFSGVIIVAKWSGVFRFVTYSCSFSSQVNMYALTPKNIELSCWIMLCLWETCCGSGILIVYCNDTIYRFCFG